MSIQTQINALTQDKIDIANAIITKGGTVNSGDGFDNFAADIATIPGTGMYIMGAVYSISPTGGSAERVSISFSNMNAGEVNYIEMYIDAGQAYDTQWYDVYVPNTPNSRYLLYSNPMDTPPSKTYKNAGERINGYNATISRTRRFIIQRLV